MTKKFEQFTSTINESRMGELFNDLNGDRIGKTVINMQGKEDKGTVVLSDYAYASKTNGIKITEFDPFGSKHTTIELDKNAAKALKKFI